MNRRRRTMAGFGRLVDSVMSNMARDDAYEKSTEVVLFRDDRSGRPWFVRDVAAGAVRIYNGGSEGEMVGGLTSYSMPVKMAAQMTRRPNAANLADIKAIDEQLRDLHTRRRTLLHDAWLAGDVVTIDDVREWDANRRAVLGDR